jgi:hypothetical protein
MVVFLSQTINLLDTTGSEDVNQLDACGVKSLEVGSLAAIVACLCQGDGGNRPARAP